MIVRNRTDILKGFPELFRNRTTFLTAISEWPRSENANSKGVRAVKFSFDDSGVPIIEFEMAIADVETKASEIEVFFPADDLLLFVGRRVLSEEDFSAFSNRILDNRLLDGRDVYQRYVIKTPGPGWQMGSATKSLVVFDRVGVEILSPVIYWRKGAANNEWEVQMPFPPQGADHLGPKLNMRPVAITSKGKTSAPVPSFLIFEDIAMEAGMFKARTEVSPLDHLECGSWKLRLEPTKGQKGLGLNATNQWIGLADRMAVFCVSQLITDERLTLGTKANWSLQIPGNDQLSGSGVVQGVHRAKADQYTAVAVSW